METIDSRADKEVPECHLHKNLLLLKMNNFDKHVRKRTRSFEFEWKPLTFLRKSVETFGPSAMMHYHQQFSLENL